MCIRDSCNEKLTLSAMAEACQVSTGDFCRFFKKHMEMTPFEYLQKCRIWNSMDAVLEKTASMGDIAVENLSLIHILQKFQARKER